MKSAINTNYHRPSLGQGAFVYAAASMTLGSSPCLIALQLEPSLAWQGTHADEDQVQPGERCVDV